MTDKAYSDAVRRLPKFAKGLATENKDVRTLRVAVMAEITLYKMGENPLDQRQLDALKRWLDNTPRPKD